MDKRQKDRRQKPPIFSKYLFRRGRRVQSRRDEITREAAFVDQYLPKEYALIASLLLLGVFDALMTTIHLGRGATEANPFMDIILTHSGTWGFWGMKLAITVLGCFLLLRTIRTKGAYMGTQVLLALYGAVSVYHVVLL